MTRRATYCVFAAAAALALVSARPTLSEQRREILVAAVDGEGRPVEGGWALATCGRRLVEPRAGKQLAPGVRQLLVEDDCSIWSGASGYGFSWAPRAEGGTAVLEPEGIVELVLTDRRTGERLERPPVEWLLEWQESPGDGWLEVPPEVVQPEVTEPGHVALRGLAAGAWRLALRSNRYAVGAIPPVAVPAGGAVRLALPLEPMGLVCGFVVAPGKLAADAFVRWWQIEGAERGAVELDREGEFCIDTPPASHIGLAAIDRLIESDAVYTYSPADGIVVTIPEGTKIKGRVEIGGEPPLPGSVTITAYLDLDQGSPVEIPPLVSQRVEEPEGRFELRLPTPRPYRLVFKTEGLAPTILSVDPAELTEELVVTLKPGATLLVSVEDGIEGGPVAGARVVVDCTTTGGSSLRRAGTTGGDGEASLAGLPPGECRAEARHAGKAPAEATVELAEDDVEISVVLTMGQEAAIRGVVVAGAADEPVAGARLSAQPFDLDAPAESAVSAPDGSFRIGGLAPGPHRVEVRSPSGAATETLLASVDERAPEIVRLERTGVLRVRAVGRAGPLAGASIHLSKAGFQQRGRTNADGQFAFDEVPAGTFTIDVALDGGRAWCTQRVSFVLEEPREIVVECEREQRFSVSFVDRGAAASGGRLLLVGSDGSTHGAARFTAEAVVFEGVTGGEYELVEVTGTSRRVVWRGALYESAQIPLVLE